MDESHRHTVKQKKANIKVYILYNSSLKFQNQANLFCHGESLKIVVNFAEGLMTVKHREGVSDVILIFWLT